MASTMVRKLVSELVVAADRFCKLILQALFDVVINDGLLAPKGDDPDTAHAYRICASAVIS